MGYDAYVNCNCLRDGKASTPPHAEFVKMDGEGVYLDLPWKEHQEKQSEFSRWLYSSPCDHPRMKYCDERLANISGMVGFRKLIAELGSEDYPVLSTQLPSSNGGYLPAGMARGLQYELEQLELEPELIKMVSLRELRTDRIVAQVETGHSQPFIMTAYNKYHYILSQEGFYIIENKKVGSMEIREKVFSAMRLTQLMIKPEEYLLSDADSSDVFLSEMSLDMNLRNKDEEFEFAVENVLVTIAEEFSYIIRPLKRLAAASLATGNPICWC